MKGNTFMRKIGVYTNFVDAHYQETINAVAAQAGFSAAFPGMFAFNALSVGGAELLVCYVLGIPLLSLLERMKIFPEKTGKIAETA